MNHFCLIFFRAQHWGQNDHLDSRMNLVLSRKGHFQTGKGYIYRMSCKRQFPSCDTAGSAKSAGWKEKKKKKKTNAEKHAPKNVRLLQASASLHL